MQSSAPTEPKVPTPSTPPAAPTPTAPSPSPAGQPLAPPPDLSRPKAIADKILGQFPSAKVDYVRAKRVKVTTSSESIKEVATFVKDQLGFDYIGTVSGVDYPPQNLMEVIYFVGSVSKPGQEDLQVCLAARVSRESPAVPSLVEVWPGAEYHERETFEMFGINFQGHPDLRRLLLPEDWNDIPPLRKDYTSPGR